MQRAVGILVSGEPGQGKTLCGLSFIKPKGETVRVVTDMENRSWLYQGEEEPDKLRFQFYYWPQPGQKFGTEQLLSFYEGLSGEVDVYAHAPVKPDVWVIDNVMLFQRQLQRILGKQPNAIKIVNSMDLVGFGMLLQYWKAPDPQWWNLLKTVIGELILTARNNGISIIATTEMGNYWVDYGKSIKRDKQGNIIEGQRILGKTAKALLAWRQLLDAVWVLDRTVKSPNGQTHLKQMPTITMDLFNPKGSLVGIPAQFEWTGWGDFWQRLGGTPETDFSKVIQETQVPTPEELEEAEAATQAVGEPEVDDTEEEVKSRQFFDAAHDAGITSTRAREIAREAKGNWAKAIQMLKGGSLNEQDSN